MNNAEKIKNLEELKSNLEKIESYLNSEATNDDFNEITGYISRGHNFVSYMVNGEYHFAPSRFVGYKNNSLAQQIYYRERGMINGGSTDTRLSSKSLLGEPVTSEKFDKLYKLYCKGLGVKSYQGEKEYWILKEEFFLEATEPYEEGDVLLRVHKQRERNQKARQRCIDIKGSRCSVCDIDFSEDYGELGSGYIQVHHINPIATKIGKYIVDPENDLEPVCANCHAMLHRSKEQLSISSLKGLLSR